jgi:general secretion pathway protein M
MSTDLRRRFLDFWQARSSREQHILAVGGGVLLFGLLYGAIYAPLHAAHSRLTERLPPLRAQHRLLVVQVSEIERIRRDSGGQLAAEMNLQRRIQSSAQSGGLQDGIVSITPLGDLVQVITRDRPVNLWLGWLQDLQRQGVSVSAARLQFSEREGTARLEVTFAGALQ